MLFLFIGTVNSVGRVIKKLKLIIKQNKYHKGLIIQVTATAQALFKRHP